MREITLEGSEPLLHAIALMLIRIITLKAQKKAYQVVDDDEKV